MSAQGDRRAKLFGVKQQQVGEDNVGSDDEFEKSKVESEIRKTRNQTKASLQRTKRVLEETKEIGSKTATTMETQTKQMQRIRGDAADVEDYLQKSRGVVDDMNRNWVSRLLFYNRKDNKPPPVEWNNRNEEELGAAKAMIDKQKRINRKKKALASKRRAEEKAKNRPWWLGGKKNKKPKQPEYSDDSSSLADDLDALSLGDDVQSQRQDELATDLQGQIERNNRMVGENKDQLRRVNRRVKRLQQEQEKEDGFLNANDKLAIQGLTQSFKTKMNG
ncbi:hypothetical protein Pmar_PMAR003539 [Perkinsus marinus ATCC 50983]|uniref:t-SNARE coiled-coil homology domain-containing protein n=1 Tax=Perkinsus marinus (strain ATCC 50983 / TXsc) TaxID=423536 RepID=C5KHL4_PERM5|nr:hypothetical protein Pmar_PMAR003539 [Perkinsus marinus ATCC 50983]EER16076.1 hypothetical protein Pmar_PMAR003539 [Perkinsus marinus ATCC 50983]|eukprot:XP_002784280.1 hypothetical protein Pmar_PMAR003539 [Perkinsus marinus ATCC 50983]